MSVDLCTVDVQKYKNITKYTYTVLFYSKHIHTTIKSTDQYNCLPDKILWNDWEDCKQPSVMFNSCTR